jgi:hypothetical protein
MEYNPQQLAEAYKKLPQSLKDLIVDLDTGEAVRNIGDKHHLHVDQMGLLAEAIGAVIFGLMPSAQFMEDITKKLGIDRIMAENIAVDVNEQVFRKVRDQLKAVTDAKESLPTPATVLHEIENPPPAPAPLIATAPVTPPAPVVEVPVTPAPPTPSVFEQKMAGSFALPKESEITPPTAPVDPYREPAL